MFTIEYKGFYINGYCDKPECKVVFPNGSPLVTVSSVHAAKLAITRFLKKCSFKKINF
jgi:hypothetical protein